MLATFFFVALAIGLQSAGIYVVYRFTKREFTADLREYQRHMRKQFRKVKGEMVAMQVQINQISLMKTDGKAKGPTVQSPFEAMETRYQQQFKNTVVKGPGVEQQVPTA